MDRNLLVFLEGTRTKDEHHNVGVFKNGGIRPAYSAQSTLVPIAIDRSWEVFSRQIHKKEYNVQLTFLPPIVYEDYKEMSYQQLADHVRQLIVDKLSEMRKSETTQEDR
jgi:1-acyl-sn-glycerol-3-phosphate acyltransferase